MTKHFYAFGSICRGEVSIGSDVDLLACVEDDNSNLSKEMFSIYKYQRLQELWEEGNPFAWHLHKESKIIYSSDGRDFLQDLGMPAPYKKWYEDCEKFKALYHQSYASLQLSKNSVIFNISCLFLAARNFATCYSLSRGNPVFSRRSPILIKNKLEIDEKVFEIFSRSRILSTRGHGESITDQEISDAINNAPKIIQWMNSLTQE